MSIEDDQKSYGNIEIKEGWIDLRLGNPVFLQIYWDNDSIGHDFFNNRELMEYSKQRGEIFLTEAIMELHEAVGNVDRPRDYEVVIGNGSSQVLASAMWAFKKRGFDNMVANVPFWPRFGVLAEQVGMTFNKGSVKTFDAEIVTAPNNPDGSMGSILHHDGRGITDLNYNWPTYTNTVYKGSDDVMVYGLAKLSGHASSRIGWAFVKDKEFAKDMNYYIEVMTSGVSVDAQARAATLIDYIAINTDGTLDASIFEIGNAILKDRWKKLNDLFSNSRVMPESSNGMFFYGSYQGPSNPMDEAKILSLAGPAFGDTKKKFRINIGCSALDFKELIKRLEKVIS